VAGALFSAADAKRLDRLALVARRLARADAPGERRSRRAGTGGEFADHRAYALGDDPRYVDWNVYGRLGDLVVKRFEAETSVDLLLLVDRSASMEGAKSEVARRLAGALGHVALRRRDTVALAWLPLVPERPLETFRSPARLDALFAALVETPGGGRTDHGEDLRRLLSATTRRGPAVLLSDFYDPAGAVAGLTRLLGRGFETTALHLLDASDVALAPGESLRCVDRETGEAVDVDATPRFLADLHAAWRRRAERLHAWCVARGVAWQGVEVGRPFWEVVQEMARGGVLVGA
jgi:uncharacterized protein (DUF58 family)